MLKKSAPLCPIKCRGHDHGAGCKGPGAATKARRGEGELEPAQPTAESCVPPPVLLLPLPFPNTFWVVSGLGSQGTSLCVQKDKCSAVGPPRAAPSRSAPGLAPHVPRRAAAGGTRPPLPGLRTRAVLAEMCPTSGPGAAFPSSSLRTQPALAFFFTRVRQTLGTPTPCSHCLGSRGHGSVRPESFAVARLPHTHTHTHTHPT